MKYYLVAGEASGDLHGSNLIKGLKMEDPQAEFRCWGGDLMEAEGAHLVRHYKESAIMGFVEVLLNIKKLLGNIALECPENIAAAEVDPEGILFGRFSYFFSIVFGKGIAFFFPPPSMEDCYVPSAALGRVLFQDLLLQIAYPINP